MLELVTLEVVIVGVSIGDTCRLYKKCKICDEYKYLKEFPTTGGRKNGPSSRKSYCWDCKDRKHEKIIDSKMEYIFDTSLLDASKEITVRGRALSNYRYKDIINYDKARKLVEEGAAGIVHNTLIHHFFNKKSLKKYVLERDGYTCHYCGFYGDTLDHKVPKTKGGLSTPSNCVCACLECNQIKDDIEYEEYINIVGFSKQS